MEYCKFKIEYYGRQTNVIIHALESFCYLGHAKLVSYTTKRGGWGQCFRKTTTAVVGCSDEAAWNRLHSALFHQWYGFDFIEKIPSGSALVPVRPTESGANSCMGKAFIDEVYLTTYVNMAAFPA